MHLWPLAKFKAPSTAPSLPPRGKGFSPSLKGGMRWVRVGRLTVLSKPRD